MAKASGPAILGRVLRFVPLVGMVLAIAFFALKPSPEIRDLPFVPQGLGRYLDQEDFLCNIGAFGLLALIVHASLSGWRREAPGRILRRGAGMAALVIALECAQLFLPRRHFDLSDIASGVGGVAVASLPWVRFKAASREANRPAEEKDDPSR